MKLPELLSYLYQQLENDLLNTNPKKTMILKIIDKYINLLKPNNPTKLKKSQIITGAYLNVGIALFNISKYSHALSFFHKAVIIFDKLKNQQKVLHIQGLILKSYINHGKYLCSISSYNNALINYNKGITYAETIFQNNSKVIYHNILCYYCMLHTRSILCQLQIDIKKNNNKMILYK